MIKFTFTYSYKIKFKSSYARLNLRPAINEIDEDRKLCLSTKGRGIPRGNLGVPLEY